MSANGWDELERFLRTDDLDAGCAETMDVLDVYVEMLLRGESPHEHFPGVAVHLKECDPCADDLEGLLAAVGGGAA
jgi:hypothetical protein